MELKEIKKIIQLMSENDLSEFEMEDQGSRILIKRGSGGEPQLLVSPAGPAPMVAPAAAPPPAPEAPTAAPDEDAGLADIKSPMVGTFYRASSPDAEPLVSIGDEVEADTVLCIIEAMKVMNEIKAETRGVIRKILVENGMSVEFGQPLFKIEAL